MLLLIEHAVGAEGGGANTLLMAGNGIYGLEWLEIRESTVRIDVLCGR